MSALLDDGFGGLPETTLSSSPGCGEASDEVKNLATRISPLRQAATHNVLNIGHLVASFALVSGDAGAFLAAWAVLLLAGYASAVTLPAAVAVAVAAMTAFWLRGLYPGYRLHDHERLRRRTYVTLEVGAAGGLVAGAVSEQWTSVVFVLAFIAVGLGFQILIQGIVMAALHRAGRWGESAAIVGNLREADKIRAFFERNWRYGIRPGDKHARIAVVALPVVPVDLMRLRLRFPEVLLLGSVPGEGPAVALAHRFGEIGLTLPGKKAVAFAFPDRLLDMAVALPSAVVLAPVMGLAGLAIRMVDPGPVLYRQMRVGLDGREFSMLKFRTMYLDAEVRLERLLQVDPRARAEWETHFKLRDDPRILPVVGRLLRASSVDELPQLFNVIAGRMRIVGPRPFPGYHLAAMEPDFRSRRCEMKPGLTGLWQISERSTADIPLQQQIDDFYIENRCFWFDLYIILSTVAAVLRGRGAY